MGFKLIISNDANDMRQQVNTFLEQEHIVVEGFNYTFETKITPVGLLFVAAIFYVLLQPL